MNGIKGWIKVEHARIIGELIPCPLEILVTKINSSIHIVVCALGCIY